MTARLPVDTPVSFGDHRGQVSRVDGARFRVTWLEPERERGKPRSRTWHMVAGHGLSVGWRTGDAS